MGSGCWRSGCIYSFVFGLYQLPCELPGVPEPFHSQSVAEPIVLSRSISAIKLVGIGTMPMGGPTVFWPPGIGTVIGREPKTIWPMAARFASSSFHSREFERDGD